MNTRRVRAGGPPPCASSGCNGPVEGECMGVCHRINTHCMTKKVATVMPEMPVQMHEPGRLTKLRQFYRNLPFGKPKVKA